MISPAPEPVISPARLVLRRIGGVALRHVYLYLGSWPRLVEMMYWPMLNMLLFGFVSLSIVRHMGHVSVLGDAYLCGVMLAEINMRTVMAVMVMYMEEVWSRNLGHMFASPLRLRDYAASLIGLSTARCLVSVIPAFVLVYAMFGFSILHLGWALPAYVALLCMNGWWYGFMIMALLMRFGLAAEWLGWMGAWLLMPFMAPYYPVSILPQAFQWVSWALPGTYVFESMKQQLATGTARIDYIVISLGLNLGYLVAAGFVLSRAFRSAKKMGGLLQMGE
ncbi:MAG: ABC transporter permease [Alphaproteobacteria bacterium]|nr:ABC transporter permease [Alphaproteobacteria bacterium]